MSLIRQFLTHMLPAVIKPLHVLWNEIIGFFFICFAIVSIPSVYKAVVQFEGEPREIGRIAMGGLFSFVMLFFGITSFLRARKIKRS